MGDEAEAAGASWFSIIKRATLEAFSDAFTKNVILEASIASTPFVGAKALRRFFDTTREMFDAIRFTRQTEGELLTILEWEATYRGGRMIGLTVLERNGSGTICRVRTFYGPIEQAIAFSTDLAGRLAAEERGAGR